MKGQCLMALYTLRSDRQLCEQLNYNLLFRWFLDMSLEESGLDPSNYSRLRARLVESDVVRRFFDQVVRIARGVGWLSAEHFTVDGTLSEACASLKSINRKVGTPPKDGGDGQPAASGLGNIMGDTFSSTNAGFASTC